MSKEKPALGLGVRIFLILCLLFATYTMWDGVYFNFLTIVTREGVPAEVTKIQHFTKLYEDKESARDEKLKTFNKYRLYYTFTTKDGKEVRGYTYDNWLSDRLKDNWEDQGFIKSIKIFQENAPKEINVGSKNFVFYNPSNPKQFYSEDDPEVKANRDIATIYLVVFIAILMSIIRSFKS